MSDATQPTALPLFYRQPQALEATRHARLRLAPPGDYRFAAGTNAVALLATEFAAAARAYPIVFGSGANAMPIAVLGVKQEQNLFVDQDGKWERGAYLPAYVRRYPFIFFEPPDKRQLTLCIDMSAKQISVDAGQPLFEGGEPTATTKQALEFCTAFQRDAQATRVMVDALDGKGLLVERRADVALDGGDRLALSGFRVVDEAKFNAVDDATIVDWRRRGWLGAIYAHLLSAGAWAGLVERAARRAAPAA